MTQTNEQPSQYLFIWNPAAGRKDLFDQLTPQIQAALKQSATRHGRPRECVFVRTSEPGHAARLAADWAHRHGADGVVIACGGDGTAGETASGLSGTPTALSILPVGTSNDFAKAVLSTTNPIQLIPRLADLQIRPIDLIDVNGDICLNIVSLGFDTVVLRRAVHYSNQLRVLGALSYPLAIIASLFSNRRFTMEAEIEASNPDGTVTPINWQRPFILAAICNGSYYGGGFHPAPLAQPDDGQLWFSVIDAISLPTVLSLLPRYKKGTHADHPAVHGWAVKTGVLRSDEPLLANRDGEIFSASEIRFQILPNAMRFGFC